MGCGSASRVRCSGSAQPGFLKGWEDDLSALTAGNGAVLMPDNGSRR
jgi:hypothetical protein